MTIGRLQLKGSRLSVSKCKPLEDLPVFVTKVKLLQIQCFGNHLSNRPFPHTRAWPILINSQTHSAPYKLIHWHCFLKNVDLWTTFSFFRAPASYLSVRNVLFFLVVLYQPSEASNQQNSNAYNSFIVYLTSFLCAFVINRNLPCFTHRFSSFGESILRLLHIHMHGYKPVDDEMTETLKNHSLREL